MSNNDIRPQSRAGGARRPQSAARARPGSAARARPSTTVEVPLTGSGPVLRSVGDRIKLRKEGWKQHYSGTIQKVHVNGTYDVECDDGERVADVVESMLLPSTSASQLPNIEDVATTSTSEQQTSYRPGDSVMAQIPGWAIPYKAVINRVNADGTYDLKFEDGDRVNGVGDDVFVTDNISHDVHDEQLPPPAPSPTNNNNRTQSPEQVQQGESEQSLPQKRPTPPSVQSRGSSRSFAAGDRVEARAPGWTSFYRGTIINVSD